jgi:hypothetical protein
MQSTLTFFQNAYDNAVTAECMHEFEWEDLVLTLVDGLVISNEKNSLGFVWARYNVENPVVLAPVSNTDETPRLHRTTGLPMARRDHQNLIEYYGLALDYDGGRTLAEVKEDLAGIRHFGYTSFNHVVKGVDKFRVLLPFSTPCPVAEFRARTRSFKHAFPGTDARTFDLSRLFYAPNVAADNERHYECWLEEGLALDWQDFEAVVEEEYEVKPDPAIAQLRSEGKAFGKDGTGLVDWKTFDIVQFAADAGLNPKRAGSGKWNVICPRIHEHSTGQPSGTVIYEGSEAHFYCSHSHGSSWFFDHFAAEFNTRAWKKPWCDRLIK